MGETKSKDSHKSKRKARSAAIANQSDKDQNTDHETDHETHHEKNIETDHETQNDDLTLPDSVDPKVAAAARGSPKNTDNVTDTLNNQDLTSEESS